MCQACVLKHKRRHKPCERNHAIHQHQNNGAEGTFVAPEARYQCMSKWLPCRSDQHPQPDRQSVLHERRVQLVPDVPVSVDAADDEPQPQIGEAEMHVS